MLYKNSKHIIDYHNSLKVIEFMKQSIHTQMNEICSLTQIIHYALEASDVPGDIVELGCFQGHVSKILSVISPEKTVHVYDSFDGLPKSELPIDGKYIPGIMATSVDSLVDNFNNDKIKLPVVHQGWFEHLGADDLPNQISFALLDGDLHDSTCISLNLVYNKMSPGGVIIIDDYFHETWNGVKVATDNFFKDKPEQIKSVTGTHKVLIIKI